MENTKKRKETKFYTLISRDLRSESTNCNRVTVHTKKDIIEKILISVKTEYILLESNKEELDQLLNLNLDNLDLNKDLTSEANIYLEKFIKSMNDDLNTSVALATFWSTLGDKKLSNEEKYILSLKFDKYFGLNLNS